MRTIAGGTPSSPVPLNLRDMGVQNGEVIELGEGFFSELTIRADHQNITVRRVSESGFRPVLQKVNISGVARHISLSGFDVVGPSRETSTGIEVVSGPDSIIENLLMEDLRVSRCCVGMAIAWNGGYIGNNYLFGSVLRDCSSLGAWLNGGALMAEGNIVDQCGGDDPNRDPTQTRGVYISTTTPVIWKTGLFSRCAMNGIRNGTMIQDNLFLDCGMGVVVNESCIEVSGNVIMLAHDCVPGQPHRALAGGVEVSGGLATLVHRNTFAHPRALGDTFAVSVHGDRFRRYGSIRVQGNTSVGHDLIHDRGLAIGADDAGMLTSWALDNRSCPVRNGGSFVLGQTWTHGNPPNRILRVDQMADPTRDPKRFSEEVLGASPEGDADAVSEIVQNCIARGISGIREAHAWLRKVGEVR